MARYRSQNLFRLDALTERLRLQRGLLFGAMIIGALLAFEIFNFSTTEFALGDLLGASSFSSVRWATILALAFCGIDFAGIARLFTPEEGDDEPAEIWYLFGAWLLAATMNAMLTWWGVSIAILDHQTLGNAVIDRGMLLKVVPIFVAVMVWLSRVLIIGTFSVAGERLFSQRDQKAGYRPQPRTNLPSLNRNRTTPNVRQPSLPNRSRPAVQSSFQPAPKAKPYPQDYEETPAYIRPEPTYHPISMKSGNNRSSGYR